MVVDVRLHMLIGASVSVDGERDVFAICSIFGLGNVHPNKRLWLVGRVADSCSLSCMIRG